MITYERALRKFEEKGREGERERKSGRRRERVCVCVFYLFICVCGSPYMEDDTNSTNKTTNTEIIIFIAHLFCTDLKTITNECVWIILTSCTMYLHVCYDERASVGPKSQKGEKKGGD